uniref:Cytochrome P450 2C23-like isoform X2 n=1 Tax=Callorhinus ursinus TaxID=34884 RepID=A0A3Q7PQC8_CALUR|nr:cytochrome P450 2C23-like isoform X2 [Callorhinus ursinus]XP_025735998.1 cytochrome P450 2C23-like isoform X2 [Callorhinus ursinus]
MALLSLPTFLVACVAFLLFIFVWRREGTHGLLLPPGPPPLPIIGNILQVKLWDLPTSLSRLAEQYGPVYSLRLGPHPIIVLHGHEAVKDALCGQAVNFGGRGRFPIMDNALRGYGIVFSHSQRWKQLRRFTLMILRNLGMGKRSMEDHIQEEAQHLVQALTQTEAQPVDPTFILACAPCNIISSILFKEHFDYQDEEFLQLIMLLNENFSIVSSFWAQEKHNPYSEFNSENLVAVGFNLFSAGTETVTSTLRLALLILLKHPEVESRVHEEIDKVVGRDRVPCMSDRAQMPYTDAVVHEVQRYINLIPSNLPHAVIQDTKFRQFFIPKGTTVFPLLSSVLYDSKEFTNPQRFDPNHFLDKNGSFRKSDFFIPFSIGKRACLGEGLARMEIFLFLTTILQNFTLKPVVDEKELSTDPMFNGFLNIRQSFKLCFLPRLK